MYLRTRRPETNAADPTCAFQLIGSSIAEPMPMTSAGRSATIVPFPDLARCPETLLNDPSRGRRFDGAMFGALEFASISNCAQPRGDCSILRRFRAHTS